MKTDKFFALAKERGVEEAQIQIIKGKNISMSLFHREMDNYSISDSQNVIACGVVDGKFGSCRTEKIGDDAFSFLIDGIIESARLSEKTEKASLFKGSPKYQKRNVYAKNLALAPIERKINLLHEVENDLFAYDKRISEVEGVQYSEEEAISEFHNSFGLNLTQKSNYFVVMAAANAKDGSEVKSAWDLHIGNDLSAFDPAAFAKKIADEVLAEIGAAPCPSGKYPTVLRNKVFSDLVTYFVAAASSEEVQRKSSFLAGKVNAKVASECVTISEKPLTPNVFFSYFDDEGVAKQNKDIVRNGILKTYLYNRETAAKDGVASTGNAQWMGDKIGVGFENVFVEGTEKTFADLLKAVKEGVYITEIAGLGTGINENSGDFSCQAQGFMIRDGKLAEPLTLITLSGNLLQMLRDAEALDGEYELSPRSITAPNVLIKEMSIGGK